MNRKTFFDHCRGGVMGPTLDGDEVSGAEAILDAMAAAPISWCAYALATAWRLRKSLCWRTSSKDARVAPAAAARSVVM